MKFMLKKILLIYPPLSMEARYGKGLKDIGAALPPLGLLYLAAVIEKAGYEVKVHDSDLLNSTLAEILNEVAQYWPDFIGIYCNTANYHRVIEYADSIKKISPAPICLGGPHPITEPKAVLKNKSIDFAVLGEGEITISELLKSFFAGLPYDKIKGLAWKDEHNVIFVNEIRELIEDLDTLPLPARHLLPIEKYRPSPQHYLRLPSTSMITSRGCPFGCLFCASRNVWGRKYRARSVSGVIEEIKFLINKYGIKDINFWDDLWGLRRDWVEEFCRQIAEQKIDISWSCERRVDTVDLEILKLMKQAGCYSIFYGIESFDQDCLDAVNKGITVEQAENVIRLTKQAGIEVRANFMLGLPKETPEKARAMIKRICKLNPDYVKFNIITPYPGTPFYELAQQGKWGSFKEDYDRSTNYFVTFLPFGYKSHQELEDIRKSFFRKFHLRPRYIFTKLTKIKSFKDLKKYWRGFRAIVKI